MGVEYSCARVNDAEKTKKKTVSEVIFLSVDTLNIVKVSRLVVEEKVRNFKTTLNVIHDR